MSSKTNTPPDAVTAVQMDNLTCNHGRWPRTAMGTFKTRDGETLQLQRQGRDLGRQCYYAATMDGEPVAYVAGHRQKRGTRTRHVIGSTFVAPAWRRKHLATELYKAILATGETLVSDWERTPVMDTIWLQLQHELPRRRVVSIADRFIAIAGIPLKTAP